MPFPRCRARCWPPRPPVCVKPTRRRWPPFRGAPGRRRTGVVGPLSWQYVLGYPRHRQAALRNFLCPFHLAWTQEVTVMSLDPRKLGAEFLGTLVLVFVDDAVATE